MQFNLLAIDAKGTVQAVAVDAANEAAARDSARQQGLEVFSIEQKTKSVRITRRVHFPTMLFSMELRSLLDAGLNLVEALQTLAEKDAQGERHEVVTGIVAALHRGESFSQAIAALPQHFSPLYVATVKAAERTGSIKEALGRYIEYQQELDRVKKKVVSASIYPAILMVVGALVIGFLMLYVVPRFAKVYEDMRGTLPFFSQILLAFGGFVGRNVWAIAATALATIFFAAWSLSRPQVRHALQSRLWQIPAVGERMRVYQLARLYRTAGMLLRAGIPAVQMLDMVTGLLSAHLQSRISSAKKSLEEGKAISASFDAAGLATPVAARMMAVGERSGDMGRMFSEIARFHDDEVARFIDVFTRTFEPVLMAVLGLAIGGVVVLMYMPIFELAGSIR